MRAGQAESTKGLIAAATGAALAALSLASCQPVQRPVPERAPERAPAVAAAAPAHSTRYVISGGDSLVVVVAHRGGALAALGHNHVIASHHLLGTVDLADPRESSQFELRMPVELLSVDEPGLRAGRGEDFPPEVPQGAREGTRANMLGPDLLEAPAHPAILVQGAGLRRSGEDWLVRLAITVRGHQSELEVPVQVVEAGGTLDIRSRFEVTQSSLGLTPFSAMLGALKVEDRLDVEVHLVAKAAP